MNELYIDKIRRIAEEEEKYLRYTEAMKLFQKDLELSERIAKRAVAACPNSAGTDKYSGNCLTGRRI